MMWVRDLLKHKTTLKHSILLLFVFSLRCKQWIQKVILYSSFTLCYKVQAYNLGLNYQQVSFVSYYF